MKVHRYPLKQGIKKTPKFAEKKLADFAINIGVKCGHDCAYCSTGCMMRMHPSFKALGLNPLGRGFAVIDPNMPEKVAADAKRIRHRGTVQICTTVDAWAPEAQELRLGRRCLEPVLAYSELIARILTKNAAVKNDFDLIQKYRDRVLVGISLTGPISKEDVISAVEPYASPLSERFAVLREAHRLGLRTYAMLCPLLPGISDQPEQIAELVEFAAEIDAEEIFVEAVNPRGRGLVLTAEALKQAGHLAEAAAVDAIRQQKHWSPYVANLVKNVQAAVRKQGMLNKLRYLLYPDRLTPADRVAIAKDDAGVIWL